MKLPIQARPIVRSVSSVKISDALRSGVTPSCNIGECGWIAGTCTGVGIASYIGGGPVGAAAAVSGCLATTIATSPDCRPCLPVLHDMIMEEVIKSGGGDGREGPLPPGHGKDIV